MEYLFSSGPYSVTVGGGGSGPAGPGAAPGSRGNDTVFSTITSAGGGGFDNGGTPSFNPQPGGSGAGAIGQGNGPATAGSGNDPSTSPPQGRDGGNSQATPSYGGGGGGGAGGVGAVGGSPQRTAGVGGAGSTTTIDGSPTVRGFWWFRWYFKSRNISSSNSWRRWSRRCRAYPRR